MFSALRQTASLSRFSPAICSSSFARPQVGIASPLSVRRYALRAADVNPRVQELEYSILGHVYEVAQEVRAELAAGVPKPFDRVIMCYAGDCQASGQPPLTFLRQLLVLCSHPEMLNESQFPEDVKQKARRFLRSCSSGSLGSYANHVGISSVREDIAAFITHRDGTPAEIEDIALTIGATGGMECFLNALSTNVEGTGRAGVLIPQPGYSLYPALNSKFDNCSVGYYLEEETGWGISREALESAHSAAKEYCKPRAIVVINPGNPTGQVMNYQDLRTALEFAHKHDLSVLADEVYQENVYGAQPFVSMRKVLLDMGRPFSEEVELVSLMSVSKGFYSECGFRGGYFHLHNTEPGTRAQLYKDLSTLSSAPTPGQVIMSGIMNPPRPGDPSFELFEAERDRFFSEMSAKVAFMTEALNGVPNFTCAEIEGALYAFPRVYLPRNAILAAKEMGMEPDAFLAIELVRKAGVFIIPGSGFGQKPGTFHVRITLVPDIESLKEVIQRLHTFMKNFLERYG